jgi:MFS transporter, putative metabolite:H+ symporter
MNQKAYGIISVPVIVAALGYFVDIYDLLLFSIIRVPSLASLGLSDEAIARDGLFIINVQMLGLLIGGIFWGIMEIKKDGSKCCMHRSSCIHSEISRMGSFRR